MSDKKFILVVDDDEALCNALETKFESKGYDVTICKDGVKCMEMLNKKKFDVIMTDLHMPNMDGFSVLEKIKDTKNAEVPAYVITNLGSDEHCERALKLGAKQCFVKSIVTLRDVVEIVDKELS
jgi:CheY-like chemotaxis protein